MKIGLSQFPLGQMEGMIVCCFENDFTLVFAFVKFVFFSNLLLLFRIFSLNLKQYINYYLLILSMGKAYIFHTNCKF